MLFQLIAFFLELERRDNNEEISFQIELSFDTANIFDAARVCL